MPKSTKKTSAKPVAKKTKKTTTTVAQPKTTKEPKMNFMMKVLKEREEKRKQMGQNPNATKPMPEAHDPRGNMSNPGFGRFAGPRRKAG